MEAKRNKLNGEASAPPLTHSRELLDPDVTKMPEARMAWSKGFWATVSGVSSLRQWMKNNCRYSGGNADFGEEVTHPGAQTFIIMIE
jgi:hypothetical protein